MGAVAGTVGQKEGESVSVVGALWSKRDVDERLCSFLTQKYDFSSVISSIIVGRGVTADEVEDFLDPTIRSMLPDPFHLKDMQKAADHLSDAVIAQKNITVFGDYDVDGATSSSVLQRYFRAVGLDIAVYIPDRVKEGYGPNPDAMRLIKKRGADICITVDCGIASLDALEVASDVGLDVIVMDHHLGGEILPKALAVVNPNRLDDDSPYGHLAAVGVCFLLIVAINAKLKSKGFFATRKQPDILQLLDIVALGTVCDVVPLKNINRAFVKQGLRVLKNRQNIGLRALSDVANIAQEPASYHLGFVLGPRINAGGRVGKSDLGARLLATEDNDEALKIAGELDLFNAERQAIEQMVLDQAIEQIEQDKKYQSSLIFVQGDNWHQGVIGIVAGRIKEKYNLPVAVITVNDGVGKASARSIGGVDFGSAVVAAKQSDLLIAGGGHAMAAGFSVAEDKIADLYDFLSGKFAADVAANSQKIHCYDGYLTVAAIDMQLANMLKQLEPYGITNPEPRFVISNCLIIKCNIVGKNHVSCIIADSSYAGRGKSIKAIAFRAMDSELGEFLLSNIHKNVDILAKVKVNAWQGRENAELTIEDARGLG